MLCNYVHTNLDMFSSILKENKSISWWAIFCKNTTRKRRFHMLEEKPIQKPFNGTMNIFEAVSLLVKLYYYKTLFPRRCWTWSLIIIPSLKSRGPHTKISISTCWASVITIITTNIIYHRIDYIALIVMAPRTSQLI